MTDSWYGGMEPEIIEVDDETWDLLQNRLAEPPKKLPALQQLMERFSWTD